MARARTSEHGSRSKYVSGCRCDKCSAENTAYQQRLKNRKRSASLTALPGTPGRPGISVPNDDELGRTELAVQAELQTLSAAQKQPGLTASILQMARILDAPDLATTQPSAMRQMVQGLDKLRAASAGRSGKLASVASMSQRTAAGVS